MKGSVETTPALPALVGVVLGSLVVAAMMTTAALVVADRFNRPTVELVPVGVATMVVQIDGAVATPGVYSLPAGARLQDAVSAAGGLRNDADVANINLAARIGDGESVSVSAVQPTPDPESGEEPDTQSGLNPVNINTASVAELETLPGVGPVIGERIVAYRDTHGPFASVDMLTNVEGISDTMVDELRPLVTLNE